jgi:hypothetical protein
MLSFENTPCPKVRHPFVSMVNHQILCQTNPDGGSNRDTLIFIMIVFFLTKKEKIVVPNAAEKSRTDAFQSQDQMLSLFLRL